MEMNHVVFRHELDGILNLNCFMIKVNCGFIRTSVFICVITALSFKMRRKTVIQGKIDWDMLENSIIAVK